MRPITFVLLAGLASFTACSETTPVEPLMTDTQVEEGIRTRFAADADLRVADLNVDADVDDHKITVSGTVPTEALRTRAVDMAQTFQAGMVVDAKIDVKPREIPRAEYTEDMAVEARDKAKSLGNKIGGSLDDAWIHTKITTKLATDGDTPRTKMNVDVDNNVVTLRGEVDTMTAKDEAERIAKETDGVTKVVNRLVVEP